MHHCCFSLLGSVRGRKKLNLCHGRRVQPLPCYSHSHGVILDSRIALLGSQRTIWTLNCYPTWMEVAAQPTGFYSFLLRSSLLSCLSSFIPGSVGDLFCSQFSHLFLSSSVLDGLVQLFREEAATTGGEELARGNVGNDNKPQSGHLNKWWPA